MKTKKMKLLGPLMIIASLGLLISPASAALTISAGDVVDNEYTYSLVNEAGWNTIFTNDVQEFLNVERTRETPSNGYTSYVAAGNGKTEAYFTYVFDFTSAGYNINNVTFNDYFRRFTSNATMKTQYSIDGITWHDIRSTSSDSATVSTTIVSETLSSLPEYSGSISSIYYKVLFIPNVDANDTPIPFAFIQYQWGRAVDGATMFSANFDLTSIPEPSSFAFLSGVLVFGILGMRRSFR